VLAEDVGLAGELSAGASDSGTLLALAGPATLGAASRGPDVAHPAHAMVTAIRTTVAMATVAMRRFTCIM